MAALDKMPGDFFNTDVAETMGAYRRFLKLSPPVNNQSKYYILIEGENGTELSLSSYKSTDKI